MDYPYYVPHPIVPSDDWHNTLYPHQNLVYSNLPWFIYDNPTLSHPISVDISPTSTTPPWDWGTTPPFTPITCESVPPSNNTVLPHEPSQPVQLTPQLESEVVHQAPGPPRTGNRSHYMSRTTFESYLNDLDFTTITPPHRTSNLSPLSQPISNPKPKPAPLSLPASLPPPVHHICPIPTCRRAFKRPEHLKRHIHSLHDKSRPYTCPTCHRTFSRSDNLIQHRKIHTRPPPPPEGI